jgi:transcription initiation factor IIE alpha subunit
LKWYWECASSAAACAAVLSRISRGKPLEAIIRNLTMRQMDDLELADGFGIVLTVVRKKMEVVNDDDLIKTINH